jgi:hypothetical protein
MGISMATHYMPEDQINKTAKPQSGDSREKLLADVMEEINSGLSKMTPKNRSKAVAEIHAIADGVRQRQGQ